MAWVSRQTFHSSYADAMDGTWERPQQSDGDPRSRLDRDFDKIQNAGLIRNMRENNVCQYKLLFTATLEIVTTRRMGRNGVLLSSLSLLAPYS
jgi:hypothetical protein